MFTVITVLVLIVCILLILIVLIQNPKGGLDSAFSSSNQVMGVRKTADFLEKSTWTLGIALVVLSIVAAAVHPNRGVADEGAAVGQSKIQEQIDNAAIPTVPQGIQNNANQPQNNTQPQEENK